MLVLEELETRARGRSIYAELTGYGSTADAFRVTDSHPTAAAPSPASQPRSRTPGRPDDIGYINAHGTSTQVNDR